MNTAILAALSMIVQDIFEAMKIQADNRHAGWIAGFCDAVMWLMLFFSMDIAITSKGGARWVDVILITVANILGQKMGQVLGDKYIK